MLLGASRRRCPWRSVPLSMRWFRTSQTVRTDRLGTSLRFFGNAPARVRPTETPREHSLRQSEREHSASIVIVFMIAFPLWLFVLSAGDKEKQRDSIKAWALRQRELHRPNDGGSSP